MKTAQLLKEIAENEQKVYDAGAQKERRHCQSRHFSRLIPGSGTTELIVPVPFEPDFVEVCCHDPVIRTQKGIVAFAQFDRRALGQICGTFCVTTGPVDSTNLGAYSNLLAATTTLNNRCSVDEHGALHVKDITISGETGVWEPEVKYLVNAVKYVDVSDAERLAEVVRRLPAGGTYKIHIRKQVRDAAMTDEQWKALIAERPTYTYVMI